MFADGSFFMVQPGTARYQRQMQTLDVRREREGGSEGYKIPGYKAEKSEDRPPDICFYKYPEKAFETFS